ncbi:MAG: hypothetical protein KAQ99_08560 [Candidatus Aureabacteria bacterium]|nr:hypothetical protein [Candidatus Auribacterota bacterium]
MSLNLTKLFYIKSDKEIPAGMIRVMLSLNQIEAEVKEAKLIKEDNKISVVIKSEKGNTEDDNVKDT